MNKMNYLSQISFGIRMSSLSSHACVIGSNLHTKFKLLARYLKTISNNDGLSPSRNNCSLRRTRWFPQIILFSYWNYFDIFTLMIFFLSFAVYFFGLFFVIQTAFLSFILLYLMLTKKMIISLRFFFCYFYNIFHFYLHFYETDYEEIKSLPGR